MAFYFNATDGKVEARIKAETVRQAEELRMALSRKGVRCGDVQEGDRSFYRTLPEVKRARQILDVLDR